MELKKAELSHLAQIEALEEVCFSCPWTASQLQNMMEDEKAAFLVAVEGDAVAGYAAFTSVLDEGYIANVAVSPDHRRRGLGDALVRALADEARRRQLSFLTLEVRESNAPARALYEKHGYKAVGLRKNYYEKPTESAILMTLWLTEPDKR